MSICASQVLVPGAMLRTREPGFLKACRIDDAHRGHAFDRGIFPRNDAGFGFVLGALPRLQTLDKFNSEVAGGRHLCGRSLQLMRRIRQDVRNIDIDTGHSKVADDFTLCEADIRFPLGPKRLALVQQTQRAAFLEVAKTKGLS